MYVVSKDERYFVLHKNGKFLQFKNYFALLKWFKTGYYWRLHGQVGLTKVEKVGYNWNENCEYIVFDSLSRVVDAKFLVADVKKIEEQEDEMMARRRRHYRRHIRNNWLGFRNGPVPYTGYGNKAGGSSYRRMRTTQELRRNSWDGQYARAVRRRRHLPNEYWDISRGRRANKSWKSHKKRKQWM